MSKTERNLKFKELLSSLREFGRINFRERLMLRRAFDAGCDAAEQLTDSVPEVLECKG